MNAFDTNRLGNALVAKDKVIEKHRQSLRNIILGLLARRQSQNLNIRKYRTATRALQEY